MRSALAICMSRTEAITCLPQIVILHGCEERMRDQRGMTLSSTKVQKIYVYLMVVQINGQQNHIL